MELRLGETSKITDEGLVQLCQSERLAATLRTLDLHECREVTSQGIAPLTSLSQLTSLDLSYMRHVDHAGVASLAQLPALQTLRLCGNRGVGGGASHSSDSLYARASLCVCSLDSSVVCVIVSSRGWVCLS